jgi:hypothetical protein
LLATVFIQVDIWSLNQIITCLVYWLLSSLIYPEMLDYLYWNNIIVCFVNNVIPNSTLDIAYMCHGVRNRLNLVIIMLCVLLTPPDIVHSIKTHPNVLFLQLPKVK